MKVVAKKRNVCGVERNGLDPKAIGQHIKKFGLSTQKLSAEPEQHTFSSSLSAEVDASRRHWWWSVAKDLAGIKESSTPVPELHHNGAEVANDFDKANLLASFFYLSVHLS